MTTTPLNGRPPVDLPAAADDTRTGRADSAPHRPGWLSTTQRSVTRRGTAALPWVEATLVAVAVAVSVPLYAGCFGTGPFLPPLMSAAGLGGAVAVLTTALRWERFRTSIAAIGGGLIALGVILAPTGSAGIPTSQTWQALRDGLIGGWLRLLTSGVPMDATPTLLLTPALIVYGCAFAAAYSALRTSRILLPAVPALLALLVALVFGATLLSPSLGLTTIWLALVATTLVLRANRVGGGGLQVSPEAAHAVGLDLAAAQRHAFVGRLAFGLPVAAVVIAVGIVGTSILPIADGSHRFDVRSEVPQPFTVEQTITPLATVQSQQVADPPQPLFTVSGEGARTHLLRVAALDEFDGATWTAPHDQFLPAGHQLPTDPLLTGGSPITLHVQVTGLESPFLPIAGTPTTLDGQDLGYAARSAVLATGAGSTAPFDYTVTGLVASYDALPPDAVVAAPPDESDYLALPPPPAVLSQIATQITDGAATPYGKLLLLAAYLKAQPYDLTARPGESYGAITRMLAKAHPGDDDGFAEQHASAFAVLARILGIPARVAVGYLVDPAQLVSGQDIVVTTRSAHAWAEVPIDGFGWVPFETVDLGSAPVSIPAQDEQAAPDLERAGPIQVSDSTTTHPGDTGPGGVAAVLQGTAIGGFVLVLVMVLTAALIVMEKGRRRWRRRHAGTPSARVVGAWREVEDRLLERGVRSPRSASAADTAAAAITALGTPADAARRLAPMVGAALFAPEEPDPDTVREAWTTADRLRADLRRSRALPWHILTSLDPRPILRLPRMTRWRRSTRRRR